MLSNLLTQFQNFWQRQTGLQKLLLIAVVVIISIVVPVVLNWASQPSYSVAFTNLEEADAGLIVEKLQAQNITYQLKGAGTILVPSDKVYEVRMSMAKDGLPQGGTVGMELFSGNMLGMTDFTQKVNYQRALEGELERTIGSLSAVEAVRVHIVTPEKSLLASDQTPTTASITIQEKAGLALDAGQVRAITSLVANSVEGLNVENVVVVDTNGNLLAAGSGQDGVSGVSSAADSRRAVEQAYATDIQKKVKNLLDTVLGPNKSVVQVSVSMDWTEKEVVTSQFDPTPQAVRSSQKVSEAYTTNGAALSGIPGAASNLPTPVATSVPGANDATIYSRTEETMNYEVTSMKSKEVFHPGQDVKQVSLSVLVDGITDNQQLETLQGAISAAAGINKDRGDIISVQTLAFDRTAAVANAADMEKGKTTDLILTIVQIVAVVLIGFLILWYVQRLLRNLKLASVEVWSPILKPGMVASGLPGGMQSMSSSSMIGSMNSTPDQRLDAGAAKPSIPDVAARLPLKMPSNVPTPEEEQLQKLMLRMADENPSSVAEIIQMWLNQDKVNG